MNIFEELKADTQKMLFQIYKDQEIWNRATIEVPRDPLHGDISTNIAMIIASKYKEKPREVALKLKKLLSDIPYIAHIEVADPGFINFTVKTEKWYDSIYSILNDDKDFWEVNIGKEKRINIEYVSANPTGPMHIGHARGAIYGDALARILSKCGYEVTKEYYINDAGSQIDILIDSVILRYKEALTGKNIEIPEGLYPGEYLKQVGENLVKKYQSRLLEMDHNAIRKEIKPIIINNMMDLIKSDLSKLGVHHDVFFSEQSLHSNKGKDKIEEVLEELVQKNLIYNGTLPPPKSKIDKNWKPRAQILFRSTHYGDSEDRALQKHDGSWSYLASDFAYAKDKIDRKFNSLIYILGADHSGYVKRIKGVINALSNDTVSSDIIITQLVKFIKNDKPVKMSKRDGNIMTVSDVISEVDKDIIRFIMLTRRNDIMLDFDFNKTKEQSKDNPVFYVQYAHVRTNSILFNAKENISEAYDKFMAMDFDLSLLATEEEIQLIKLLSSWPKILTSSAKYREPHRVVFYLIEVASRFHAIWNLGKENNEYRFNIESDIPLTAARLALIESIRKIIFTGLDIIGVKAIDRM